jgi:membrane protein implicated in regulation of membrane protease activity
MKRFKQSVLSLLALAITLAVWRPSLKLDAAAFAVSLFLYLVPIVALPLILYVLLRFAYRMFVRPYVRFMRMRRYLNNKELREAARRGL